MRLRPHLIFDGRCEAAFRFYEKVLSGAIVTMLKYGESPLADQVPAEWRDKILHATLTFGDDVLMGADVLPEQYEPPQGFYLLLSPEDPAETERIFEALSEGGSVRMAAQKTFWSPCFGVVVDRFAIPWEVSCEQAPSVA